MKYNGCLKIQKRLMLESESWVDKGEALMQEVSAMKCWMLESVGNPQEVSAVDFWMLESVGNPQEVSV